MVRNLWVLHMDAPFALFELMGVIPDLVQGGWSAPAGDIDRAAVEGRFREREEDED